MQILHGENTFASREKLGKLIDEHRQNGSRIVRLETKRASVAELETLLSAHSLFVEPELVIIEELHSLPTSQRKKELIALLQMATQTPDPKPIILWESRSLTKTMLKAFPQAKVEAFTTSKKLFTWLETISPQPQTKKRQLSLLKEVLQQENEFMVLSMLNRQVRLLIQSKTGVNPKAPPFVIKKLASQARQFSLKQLLDLHSQLLHLDYQLKTSRSHLSLAQHLDLLVVRL